LLGIIHFQEIAKKYSGVTNFQVVQNTSRHGTNEAKENNSTKELRQSDSTRPDSTQTNGGEGGPKENSGKRASVTETDHIDKEVREDNTPRKKAGNPISADLI